MKKTSHRAHANARELGTILLECTPAFIKTSLATSDHHPRNTALGSLQSFFSTHSLGGVIGTLLCASLGEHVKAFVNIEGNLTASDAFFSGKAAKFHDGKTFSDALKNEILEMTDGSESFKRYFASVQFADPKTLWNLGKSGIKFSDSTIAGKEYAQLTCKKIYIYGKSTPEETQQFIKKEKLKTLFLEPFGHWPMVEDPNFYQKILDFLETP